MRPLTPFPIRSSQVFCIAAGLLGMLAPHPTFGAETDSKPRPTLNLEAIPEAATLRTHAHNDYEHDRPLLDALSHGFISVEADIHLREGELLVAHDADEVRPGRTLERLYLDPLRRVAKERHGRIYPNTPQPLLLLVDIKTEAESTYAALREVLKPYRHLLTRFTPKTTESRAVTVILSGNRPRQTLAAEPERWAAYDGRLTDLNSPINPHFMPLISDNWTHHFQWRGSGPMPEAELEKLHKLVHQVQAGGARIRFWASPDQESVWKVLLEANANLINTDHLQALATFLTHSGVSP